MNKIKQTVYEFGQPICDEMIITKDTYIENKKGKVIPIRFGDNILGQCVIDTDGNGIICNGVSYNRNDDINLDDKLKLGSFFIKESHYENDLMVLDSIQIADIIMK